MCRAVFLLNGATASWEPSTHPQKTLLNANYIVWTILISILHRRGLDSSHPQALLHPAPSSPSCRPGYWGKKQTSRFTWKTASVWPELLIKNCGANSVVFYVPGLNTLWNSLQSPNSHSICLSLIQHILKCSLFINQRFLTQFHFHLVHYY